MKTDDKCVWCGQVECDDDKECDDALRDSYEIEADRRHQEVEEEMRYWAP